MKKLVKVEAVTTKAAFAPLVDNFLKFAAVSPKTMITYYNCLKQLVKYFADNDISNPTRADLENWRDSMIDNGKSAATICLYLTAAKLFFRWLAQENIFQNIADNLKNRVKVDHYNHKKDALTAQEAANLINSIDGKNLKALRNKAIIALMVTAGVRSIEIVRANYSDIRKIQGGIYLFVQGKGRNEKSESVRIAPQVYSLIQAYIKARGKIAANAPLFVSTSRRNINQRLQTQSISRMVKANLREIGIDTPTVTCHSLRHTAATVMILAGQKLESVQMILRHKSISTTMIYNNAVNRYKNTGEIVAANVIFRF